ncbi:MAG TPA: hypothetical protein PKG60_16040 [Spirochaetota bacterium]|nr:hypothetical protein [Spirochaetota bacterium]HPS86456.1 hypothetical protein [Spirochaetota bacterium]
MKNEKFLLPETVCPLPGFAREMDILRINLLFKTLARTKPGRGCMSVSNVRVRVHCFSSTALILNNLLKILKNT